VVKFAGKQPLWRESEAQQSLAALGSTSIVGVAIFNRQLRFQTINKALASMNGVPGEAHIGKTSHHILGTAATKIETALDHVFVTGDPLSNFELTARLPARSETGHWIENYYPIKAASGKSPPGWSNRSGSHEKEERRTIDRFMLRATCVERPKLYRPAETFAIGRMNRQHCRGYRLNYLSSVCPKCE